MQRRLAAILAADMVGYSRLIERDEAGTIERPVRIWRIDPSAAPPGKVGTPVERPRKRRWRYVLPLVGVLAAAVAGLLWYQPWVPRVEAARVEHMAFPLPDKPSIAVLPFDNLSGDAAQEYFSDGLTNNIITAISQLPEVFVIARNSTFTYKGTPVKVQQVAEDLGVRYVLQGSYQRAVNRVRINAEFIDALSGRYVWAERIDRDWSDLFTVQDEITRMIVSSLSLALSEEQQARVARRYTNNLDAFGLFLQGRESYMRYAKEDNENGRALYLRAIALDPSFARAYGGLALTHNEDFRNGWTTDPRASQEVARRFARKAVETDPTLPEAYAVLAQVFESFDPEGAIEAARKAIELDPNSSDGHALLADAHNNLGQAREGIRNADIALRLNPLAVSAYRRVKGRALFFAGRYAEAVVSLRKASEMNPNHVDGRLYSAAALAKLGRRDDAEWEITQLLVQNPRLSLEGVLSLVREYIRYPDHLKNLEDGLRLAGLPEQAPVSVPEKPSIAVLPFANMSGDPEQEYFSDGIAEDIITDLSRLSNLIVIARNSSFSYKGEKVKVQEAGRDLGVKFVLEGSVRKAGNRVRITAQLVDTANGHHLWAERYDRELVDVFAVQDEITRHIVSALSVRLSSTERAQLGKGMTDSFEAYDLFLKGRQQFNVASPESTELAKSIYRRVIDIDPGFARAYGALAVAHMRQVSRGWSTAPREAQERALELALKASSLDISSPHVLWSLGYVHSYRNEFEEAFAALDRAIALAPNYADAYGLLAHVSNHLGRADKAVRLIEKAMELNPNYSWEYPMNLGYAQYILGEYEKAVENLTETLQRNKWTAPARAFLIASYVQLGRLDDADWEVMEMQSNNPEYTLSHFERNWPLQDRELKGQLLDDLRQAGMVE